MGNFSGIFSAGISRGHSRETRGKFEVTITGENFIGKIVQKIPINLSPKNVPLTSHPQMPFKSVP